jgi:hypothetical protein
MDPGIAVITPVMSHSSTSPPAHLTAMVSPPAETHDIAISPVGTQSRSLDGILLPATVIDELFQL